METLHIFESALRRQDFSDAEIVLLTESLATSSLRTFAIDGPKFPTRINDEILGRILESFLESKVFPERISLKYQRITSAGIERSLSRLILNGTLKYLDLQGNDIDSDGILHLKIQSQKCPLLSVNLSYNQQISRNGGLALSEALSTNKKLKHLYLNNCGFDLTTLIALVSSLGENEVLESLEVDRPLLKTKQEEGTNHLTRIILTAGLINLSLRQFDMFDFGACILADSLGRNNSLRIIDLECNRIGVAGAEAMASYLILAGNRGLEVLRMSYNEVGNAGCIALAEALQSNSCLKELSLKSNKIDAALVDMGRSLSKNNTLEYLSLFHNNFDQDSGKIFHDLIKHRLPYVGLRLDVDVYIVDGQYMIAENL